MSRYKISDLSLWLKYLDTDYFADDVAEKIGFLNINEEVAQKKLF